MRPANCGAGFQPAYWGAGFQPAFCGAGFQPAILVLLVAAALPFLLSAGEDPAPKPPAKPAVSWYSDVSQAFADAHEKKQRLILLMELPDQAWSRQLLERFDDPAIVQLTGDFIAVRTDVRTEQLLLNQLVVRVIPDLRVFDSDGKQLAHTTGSIELPELTKFLTNAKTAKPESGAPSLSMFIPSNDLEALRKIETDGKLPEGQNLQRLLELSSGPAGETRVEAQRLLKFWSRGIAQHLPQFLLSKTLKPRLTAFEALADLDAPLESYDPWSGPASPALISKLQTWGIPLSGTGEIAKPGTFPALPARVRAQVDADLKDLRGDDKARSDAAWQRLVAVGRGLVPILRDQSRAIVANDPATALRYDELRFRLLLGTDTLRKQPAAARKLAVGNPGERATLLGQILQSGVPDLEMLAREAACDRDALFRETAIRYVASTVEAPEDLFRESLKDADANVRVAALKAMAQSTQESNTDAIAKYIAAETNAAMIGHAISALASVKSDKSLKLLRGLLGDKRWEVRAAAVEALGKTKDTESRGAIEKLVDGDDGFVAGQAIVALKEMRADNVDFELLRRAAKKHPAVTSSVIKVIASGEIRKKTEADKLLRDFTKSENPDIRAQALAALASDTERPAFEEVAAGLGDPALNVRIAAVKGLRSLIDHRTVVNLVDEKKPMPSGYLEVQARVKALLKDDSEELHAQAILTLCYFNDWKLCWDDLKAFLSHPHEHTRGEMYETVAYLPPTEALALVRICLNDKQLQRSQDEWHKLLHGIAHTLEGKAADWKMEDPALVAYFEIFQRLEPSHFDSFSYSLQDAALTNRYDSSVPDTKNRKALAKILDTWMGKLADGDRKDLLRLISIRLGNMSEEKLRALLKDEKLEIRRMALVLIIRANTKGPEDLVKQFVTDPAPEMRRLAISAAIPSSFRAYVTDPTAMDWIGGEYSHASYNRSYSGNKKPPAVVQLPVETLDKLLKDEDEAVRVITAFLMAMEEGDQGIPVLMQYMKANKTSRDAARTVARAIVMAWNDDLTPQLEEALREMKRIGSSYEIREIWGMVKDLKGTEVKKLRAKLAKDMESATIDRNEGW